MSYYVTDLDIKRGKPGEPGRCPVALAIKRRHPNVGVLVNTFHVHIGLKIYYYPEKVARFIDDFDADVPVNPIRFEL